MSESDPTPPYAELQTARGRFFFWIGLVILPVFWVWWMRPVYFHRWQRLAGWMWTSCYLVALIAGRHVIGQRMKILLLSYHTVAIELGLVLFIWLLLRVFSIGQLVTLLLVSTDVTAILASLWIPALSKAEASPVFLVFPLVPAALHLIVEPYRRWRQALNEEGVRKVRHRIRMVLYSCLVVWGIALWVHRTRG